MLVFGFQRRLERGRKRRGARPLVEDKPLVMPTALFCRPLLPDLAHDLLVRFDLIGGLLFALPFSDPPLFTQCRTRLTDATASAFGFRDSPSANQRTAAWIMPLPHRMSGTRFCYERQRVSLTLGLINFLA